MFLTGMGRKFCEYVGGAEKKGMIADQDSVPQAIFVDIESYRDL